MYFEEMKTKNLILDEGLETKMLIDMKIRNER